MKLALGTVQFGLDYGIANNTGRVSFEEAFSILERARQAGITTLDTAIAYGSSESVLGDLGVGSWKVITKLPVVPAECNDVHSWVQEEVLGSLSRLGVKKLYGLLLHRPAQLLEDQGYLLYQALQSIKAAGWVEKIGVSVYSPAELDVLFCRFDFDLVQAPLNILERSLIETGWAERLNHSGVEVHARSVFLQGLLLMPADMRPTKFNYWAEVWQEWDRWLVETGLSPLQGCLRYANSLSYIDRIVVGVDSVDHLNQIVEASSGDLPSLPLFKPLSDARLVNPASWDEIK